MNENFIRADKINLLNTRVQGAALRPGGLH
jgi:hypothetical protein